MNTRTEALVFLHVLKTAGSTLKWIIQRQYPAGSTVTIEGEDLLTQYHAFQALPAEARGRLRCVQGHVPFGVHRWLPQGARYITMLRDPVEWTLSFHAYVRRMSFFDDHPDLTAFRGARRLDLDGFVRFLSDSQMADMQTRMISGQTDLLRHLPPYAPMTDDALDSARRNLQASFDCVGLVERFDESLLLMKRKLGWRNVHYRRLNVSEERSRRDELSPVMLRRILECNRRDAALYDEACRQFSAEILATGSDFQSELRRFQRNNVIYSKLMPLYEASGAYRVRQVLRARFKRR
jgi:hypothetical protein